MSHKLAHKIIENRTGDKFVKMPEGSSIFRHNALFLIFTLQKCPITLSATYLGVFGGFMFLLT